MKPETAPLACRTYSLEEVCRVLGISRRTLDRLRRHRAFPVDPVVGLPNRYPAKAIEALADGEEIQLSHARKGHTRVLRAVGEGRSR